MSSLSTTFRQCWFSVVRLRVLPLSFSTGESLWNKPLVGCGLCQQLTLSFQPLFTTSLVGRVTADWCLLVLPTVTDVAVPNRLVTMWLTICCGCRFSPTGVGRRLVLLGLPLVATHHSHFLRLVVAARRPVLNLGRTVPADYLVKLVLCNNITPIFPK